METDDKHECSICNSEFTLDEGGITGYFGICPVEFCVWCLSSLCDMFDQDNEELGEDKMKRVILESPYAGKSATDIYLNEVYGELCMRDCLKNYNEAPYASHLLYTRKYVLRDSDKEERKLGIEAGFFWRDVAEITVFYLDLGMTTGMKQGIDDCEAREKPYQVRHIDPNLWVEFVKIEDKVRHPEKYVDILK